MTELEILNQIAADVSGIKPILHVITFGVFLILGGLVGAALYDVFHG